MENIVTLLKFALENKVTDLFISSGKVPSCRSGGEMLQVEFPEITPEEINQFRISLIGTAGEEKYTHTRGYDISYIYDPQNRFRMNFFETVNGPCFVARPIRMGGKLDFEKLGLADTIRKIAMLERGLVLVTGTTGSGKSTTLTAMIDYINSNSRKHILTLEDPIEYLHQDKLSLISQREVDALGSGFGEALRNALRESPDVIMIGEMRDLETMQIAVTAAQTGHLVFSTLHTSDAAGTVKRLINMCPEGSREQMTYNLAQVLEAVISQRLLPRADGSGLVPAQEILVGTGTVKKQIERQDISGLELSIRLGGQFGMQNFNTALFRLVKSGAITDETALKASDNPDELKLFFRNIGLSDEEKQEQSKRSSRLDSLDMRDIFKAAADSGASDFLLVVNAPPVLCKRGKFTPLSMPELAAKDVQRLIYSIIGRQQRVTYEEKRELDFAITAQLPSQDPGKKFQLQRFRLNAFFQRGTPAMVGRVLQDRIPTPAELNLPPVLSQLMSKKQGLILVTGPTGSGKSTTLASLLNEINKTQNKHIITIEDPIEYTYENISSFIEQRELGRDTLSFAGGLRAAMRQAPNIILVGELRDTETIATAITAAETGHLVLATLHANNTVQTVERIVDSFPSAQQNQIRQQFSNIVTGVVAQRLLPRLNGHGRVAAFEIMIGTPPVQALIREGKTHQLLSVLETSASIGMTTMRSSLDKLCADGEVSAEDVAAYQAL